MDISDLDFKLNENENGNWDFEDDTIQKDTINLIDEDCLICTVALTTGTIFTKSTSGILQCCNNRICSNCHERTTSKWDDLYLIYTDPKYKKRYGESIDFQGWLSIKDVEDLISHRGNPKCPFCRQFGFKIKYELTI